MMRFLLGMVVGIVIARPILNVVNEHLTPPVREKIHDTTLRVYTRIGDYLYKEDNQ